MIAAGSYHTLTVSRISPHGLYLADDHGAEVLLPNRFVSLQNKVGDTMTVFVYHDSEERPVATTQRPLAAVGQVAYLEVVDKTIHGAFLDWGEIPKDLFVPNRNQLSPMMVGQRHVVWLYNDNVTGRVVGTAKLKGFVTNEQLTVRQGEQVDILVAARLETGFRCVVGNRHWGMLYHNQLFSPVAVGDRLQAWVRKIGEENRIDLNLQAEGFDEVRRQVDRLLELLDRAGGSLPFSDRTPPEQIAAGTGMSKKVFKRVLGFLMKQGYVQADEKGIKRIK
jgi:predicted RNA-binding protein (virulence factor B family)